MRSCVVLFEQKCFQLLAEPTNCERGRLQGQWKLVPLLGPDAEKDLVCVCVCVCVCSIIIIITGRICRRQLCRYCFYSWPIFWFFAPQGRHVALIKVKFGMEEQTYGPLLHAKWSGGLRPQNWKKWNFTNIIAPKGSLARFSQNLQVLCGSSVYIILPNVAALFR